MAEKVKLMCSYGGKIQHRHHDRKLSYVGGDTKILTVDRNINFSNLISKLNALCESNSEIRLKYKLPGQDLDALISVFDDEDVDNMFFEYDLLRRISAAPVRLRLFLFFPATVTTPVTARSVNPDFLFGFDKEYSLNANNNSEVTDMVTVTSRSENAGFVDVTPVVVQEIPVMVNDNSTATVTRGSYREQAVVYTSGYFQAGVQRGGNREQAMVYGYIPAGNREQPVVYSFVPVMPSGVQEVGSIPVSGSPLSYDATRGEVQFSTAMMTATSNHESKYGPGPQHDS